MSDDECSASEYSSYGGDDGTASEYEAEVVEARNAFRHFCQLVPIAPDSGAHRHPKRAKEPNCVDPEARSAKRRQ